MLSRELSIRGHEVVWWSSTFDHIRKVHRSDTDARFLLDRNVQLVLLRAPGYSKNVSLRRLLNHSITARRFREMAVREKRPDIILCALPTIELCKAATDYGAEHRIPVIIDIRDLWPDTIVSMAPRGFRWFARLLLNEMFSSTIAALGSATAITGATPQFVEWGLRYARRARRPEDGNFPLGYDDNAPSFHSLAHSEQFWDQHGVKRDPGVLRVCFFGTLGRQFEIATVILAARRLLGAPVQFVLCGAGDRLAHFKRIAVDCPNVVFPGWVNHSQIWTLMRRSSVGLAPYLSTENFTGHLPNKPIEYFSGRLPVVSSLKGLLCDLLKKHECGITYENGDAKGLANALLLLHEDEVLRSRLAANAFGLFVTKYTASKVYGEMADHIEKVTEGFFHGKYVA